MQGTHAMALGGLVGFHRRWGCWRGLRLGATSTAAVTAGQTAAGSGFPGAFNRGMKLDTSTTSMGGANLKPHQKLWNDIAYGLGYGLNELSGNNPNGIFGGVTRWLGSHVFGKGGVVGFQGGGEVGDNFYKHWYPASHTPPGAPMHPSDLGGLLSPAPATWGDDVSGASTQPWGTITPPSITPVPPLAGFRSQADEHRATGFGRASRVASAMSSGLIPDVALDYNVYRHWGQHSGMEQTGAVLDTLSMIPGLGGALAEGAGVGARGLGTVSRPLIERIGAKKIGDAASLAYWRIGDPVQRWAEHSLDRPGIFGGLPDEFRVGD